ncbi:MAG: TonB family protein [Thiobacillus sp.]|nr:TonB family protein [Thiobacillus sp.]
MPVNASFEEPGIPPRARRALAAVWISLGLHAAVIALVQVAPPGATGSGGPIIEARLVSASTSATDPQAPNERIGQPTVLAPSALAEAQPVPRIIPQPETTQPDALVQPSTVSPGPLSASSPAPAVAITSLVDLTYYGARDVDVLPRALREVQPDYPTEADRQRISGKVRLQVKIEADGRVSDIDVVSADPPGVFDEAAVRAFRAARFVPAEKNGRPVRVRVLIPVEFDWEGRPRQP